MSRKSRVALGRALVGIALVAALLAMAVVALNRGDEPALGASESAFRPTADQVRRGAYLALAGNCAACHSARGGAPFAGGSGIATPFGTVYSTNLTPDPATGLGAWSAADFWRALHNGRSRDGHLLYPAFPYPNYTFVTRDDSDALFAYLRSLPAVVQAATPNTLRFPYRLQASLAVWRALFFTPGRLPADPARSAEWNRGSYLVRGLGHCSACHAGRNLLGASSDALELSGGLIPMQNWYAPSLGSADEAGVADWSVPEVVALLKSGRTERGAVLGPMAEVVYRSTQYLRDEDLTAMAAYLKDLPPHPTAATLPAAEHDARTLERGRQIYTQRCADCHGEEGQGAAGAYPPLAGRRAVTLASPANLVKLVVHGGYLPATAGNPRPYGMPPFGPVLDEAEIAAVLSYVRASWGNHAPAVSTLDVLRLR